MLTLSTRSICVFLILSVHWSDQVCSRPASYSGSPMFRFVHWDL